MKYLKKGIFFVPFILIIFAAFCGFSMCCDASPDPVISKGIKHSVLPFEEENLSYKVTWSNFINAGSAELIFSKGIYGNKIPVLKARAIAKSAKWLKVLGIDVEDHIETLFDPNYRFSYFFQADIKETDYQKVKKIIFDWKNNLIEYITRQEKPAYFNLKDNTHDVLSALYYTRTLPMHEGKSYYVRVFDDGKEYLLEIKVFEREVVNIRDLSIPALKTKIILKSKGIFNRKGDVYIWFSDDSRHIPVQMRCDIFLGFFHVELADARAFFHYR
jgi:hypothetical protein